MTNTTMNKNTELNIEELTGIVGGQGFTTEQEDNAVLEALAIAIATKVIQVALGSLMPDTFDEFYKGYLNHKTAIDASIYALGSPAVIAFYYFVDKKKFWKKVYDALK